MRRTRIRVSMRMRKEMRRTRIMTSIKMRKIGR